MKNEAPQQFVPRLPIFNIFNGSVRTADIEKLFWAKFSVWSNGFAWYGLHSAGYLFGHPGVCIETIQMNQCVSWAFCCLRSIAQFSLANAMGLIESSHQLHPCVPFAKHFAWRRAPDHRRTPPSSMAKRFANVKMYRIVCTPNWEIQFQFNSLENWIINYII